MSQLLWIATACVTAPVSEPKPQTDLSEGKSPYTLDLRQSAGMKVTVQGQELHLLVLPYSDSLLFLNKDVAQRLKLKPIFFGLGTADFSDGDFYVGGKGFNAEYSVGAAPTEKIWALVMEENIHDGFDGAISFGAIPATRIRILLNDPMPNFQSDMRTLKLSGKSKTLEAERSYHSLDFSHTLALYQDPVSVNKKASHYILQSGNAEWIGIKQSVTRLFGNTRLHKVLRFKQPLDLDGFRLGEVLGEVPDTLEAEPEDTSSIERTGGAHVEEKITVLHDKKSARHAPVFYLGRDFFEDCSEIIFDKRTFQVSDQISVMVQCYP